MKRFVMLFATVIGLANIGIASGGDLTPVHFSTQANWTWAGYEDAPTEPVGVFLPGCADRRSDAGWRAVQH